RRRPPAGTEKRPPGGSRSRFRRRPGWFRLVPGSKLPSRPRHFRPDRRPGCGAARDRQPDSLRLSFTGSAIWEGNLMSLTTCTIRFAAKADRSVYVTSLLAKALQLKKKKPVTIRFGSKIGQFAFKTVQAEGRQRILPAAVRSALLVPQPGVCQIMSIGDNAVRLGPLVGILTTGPGQGSLFGSRTSLIRSLLRVGRGMAVPFAFRPRDIDWANERVH